jgi:hypothetical protein
VLQEVEAEKQNKTVLDAEAPESDGIARDLFGLQLPDWVVGFQLSLKASNEEISEIILDEFHAKVWNYTGDSVDSKPPPDRDPANYKGSPELVYANLGFDLGKSITSGIVLSPLLFSAFAKYSDPLYNETEDDALKNRPTRQLFIQNAIVEENRQDLVRSLQTLRTMTEHRIEELERQIRKDR